MHHGYRRVRDVVRGVTLDGEQNDLASLALGVPLGGFPRLGHAPRRLGVRFALDRGYELRAGFVGAQAGDTLEPRRLGLDELVELQVPGLDLGLAIAELGLEALQVPIL